MRSGRWNMLFIVGHEYASSERIIIYIEISKAAPLNNESGPEELSYWKHRVYTLIPYTYIYGVFEIWIWNGWSLRAIFRWQERIGPPHRRVTTSQHETPLEMGTHGQFHGETDAITRSHIVKDMDCFGFFRFKKKWYFRSGWDDSLEKSASPYIINTYHYLLC